MSLRIRCRLYAQYAEVVGVEQVDLEVPVGSLVADAVAGLRRDVPGGDRLPASPMVAVNQEHALPSRPLADGDELAFLPPLAGG